MNARKWAWNRLVVRSTAFIAMLMVAAPVRAQPQLLLADTTRRPHVTVSWQTKNGQTVTLQGDRGYESPGQKSPLGKNIEAYAALGGTRLDKGGAHPRGALVRVGLVKAKPKELFFEDIAEDGVVTLKLDGVFMNQAAIPRQKTGMLVLKYVLSDLTDCGLDGSDRTILATVNPDDPIKEVAKPGSGRWGGLDGKEGHGTLTATTQPDGSMSMVCTFPYPFLRHLKDPYQRSKPGAFFEPQAFHLEIELLPASIPDAPSPKELPPQPPPEAPKPSSPADNSKPAD
jgi:hypothetical protein